MAKRKKLATRRYGWSLRGKFFWATTVKSCFGNGDTNAMRYRKLTDDWDFQIGHGDADYLVDSPECVLQAVMTRLKLLVGEWFNDTAEGTPWKTQILGKYTKIKYDSAIRRRILGTQGVTDISDYSSAYDGETRKLSVTATIDTIYGAAILREVL
jgi:hypothetical protein